MPESEAGAEIRNASYEDIPALCELLGILFTREADFTPDAGRQARGLRLILDQPDAGRIFCATKDGCVIGMVSILFTVSITEGGRTAMLEDMVVHPDWRGHGIGGRLLREAILGAGEAGCICIQLLTDAANEAAIRFYGRAGFALADRVPLRLKW